MCGGKYDSVSIISMPTYTGKMPGNLAVTLMFGWLLIALRSSSLIWIAGTSMEGI